MKPIAFLAALVVGATVAAPSIAQDRGVKNVILMISDGIGFNGWLAADYYQGRAGQQPYQVDRPDGTASHVYGVSHDALNLIDEAGRVLPSGHDPAEAAGAIVQGYDPQTRWMRFERTIRNDFPPLELEYTSYTDSAAAGSAMQTGRKTANGRINMDWSGQARFRTIAEIFMHHGRAAGTVTSVMASHATPASSIAHNVSRGNTVEIFNEMVASGLDVIMGAGHPHFDDSGNPVMPENETAFRFVGGPETFGALTSREGLNGYAFIDAAHAFDALATGDALPDRVVGIARAASTLQAARDESLGAADTPSGVAVNPLVPDLAIMSMGALNVLSKNPEGLFVMIEGGAVDWMGHVNHMPRFIEEQIDFNRAVDAVIDWVETHSGWDETLLIVTSDHETGGIWGEGTWTNGEGPAVAANRSDEAIETARFHPAEDVFHEYLPVQDRGAGTIPGHQWSSGNHTNELVPLWALGAGAERFAEFIRTDLKAAELWGAPYGWTGHFVDNTSVFHVMTDAVSGSMAARVSQ